jgi:hypothetical protein
LTIATILGQGLSYLGPVDAVRQRYFVFEASDDFMVFSLKDDNPNSGYFNVVSRNAVDYVHRNFSGVRGITSGDVLSRSKRSKHVSTALIALNILYVLVAQRRARIEGTGSHSKLYFAVAKTTLRKKVSKKRAAKKKAARRVRRSKAGK